jgi:hypothetical protein
MRPPSSLMRVAKTLLYLSTGRRRPALPVSASLCKKLEGSTLILAAGMSRSASTWLYNAARLLLCSSPEIAKSFSCGWVGDLQIIPKKRFMLIKLHGYDRLLINQAASIVYSYRDIRDSLASGQRKYGHAPTMERADRLVEQHKLWSGVAEFSMRYEDMLSDKVSVVEQLAQTLDVKNYDSTAIVEEIEQLDYTSEGPKNRNYHEVNLLHDGHLTDGRNGAWKSSGNESLYREIEKKHLS